MGWYDAIAAKGMHGLALDNRGHGERAKPNEPEKYAREAMARDVFALMDHAGVERAHLVGFSMGSHVALTAALLDGGRIDHLVVGGVGGKIFEPTRDPDDMAQAMEAATPDAIADPMLKSFRHFADEQKEDRLALAACSRGPRTPLTPDSLMRIRRPTLVVAGMRDQLAGSPQGLADAIAGAKAVTGPGFEEAFLQFNPKRLLFQPAEFWEKLASDKRIVRNPQKIRSVRENAKFVSEIAAEHGSFGKFLATWPADDQVGLLEVFAKRGSRLGGFSGQYLLRFLGWDDFVLSGHVLLCLRDAGVPLSASGTSNKDLRAA